MMSAIPRMMLLVFVVIVCMIAFAVLMAAIGLSFTIVKHNRSPICKKSVITAFVAVAVAAVSWVLNFGWYRFIMTFVAVPIVHGMVFLISDLFFCKYVDKSSSLLKLNIFYVLSYLLTYLFFPDGGDTGTMYFMFGLIHSDILSFVAFFISAIAFVCSVILLVVQIVMVIKLKKASFKSEVDIV